MASERAFAVGVLLGAAFHACVASLRVAKVLRRTPLDEALRSLRSGVPFTGSLRDPDLHTCVVERLLRLLPPWRMGPCMKRSLLLLHLWSRCGLTPRVHLGYPLAEIGARRGHAWLTLDERQAEPGTSAYEEVLSL